MEKNKMDLGIMKSGSTILLRLTLIAMGLVVSAMGAGLIMGAIRNWPEGFPEIDYLLYPIIFVFSTVVVVFWTALYQAFTLLDLIDRNESFTKGTVTALQKIKYCALTIAGMFTLGMPLVFYVADKDDAPGLVLIVGALFIGVPVIVAAFAGVCQRLFQNAIDIKSENDLTV